MRINKIIKSLFLVPFILSLASCFDMGAYENEKEYFDSFDVHIINSDGTDVAMDGLTHKYTMEDFYNDNAKEFIPPEDLESNKYKYLAFKPRKEVTIGELVFYVKSETDVTLNCNIYLTNHLPSTFKNLDTDLTSLTTLKQKIKDESLDIDDPTIQLELSSSNEPKEEELLASESVSLTAGKYDSVYFKKYKGYGETLSLSTSKYIVIEFENNTDLGVEFTKYTEVEDAKNQIKARRKNQAMLQFTMFIIEGKEKK